MKEDLMILLIAGISAYGIIWYAENYVLIDGDSSTLLKIKSVSAGVRG